MKPKDNPFRAQRIDSVRYRFLDSDWDFVRLRLHQLAYHAAIVGPEGSGKTTLQLELAEHLRQQGRTICWLRLRRDNRPQHALLVTQFVDAFHPGAIAFVDGAEQLGRWQWRRLLTQLPNRSGVVITTHSQRHLPTLLHCHTSPELLRYIVAELAPTISPSLSDELPVLYRNHRGNIRDCLRELYDRVAEMPLS